MVPVNLDLKVQGSLTLVSSFARDMLNAGGDRTESEINELFDRWVEEVRSMRRMNYSDEAGFKRACHREYSDALETAEKVGIERVAEVTYWLSSEVLECHRVADHFESIRAVGAEQRARIRARTAEKVLKEWGDRTEVRKVGGL